MSDNNVENTNDANFQNWVEFLAGLETEIREAHAEFDAGIAFENHLIQPWAPPKHLASLPDELLDRAQAINKALNELQARTELGRDMLRTEIQRVNSLHKNKTNKRAQYSESVIPLYVDRSV